MAKSFQTTLFLSLVTGLIVQAQIIRADDNRALALRNDLHRSIGFYIASEKNQTESPWYHLTLKENESAKIDLNDPDRFILVLEIDGELSRSTPLELKKFLAGHPDYEMLISKAHFREPQSSPIALQLEVSVRAAPKSVVKGDSLRVQFDSYKVSDPAVWKLSTGP